MIFFLNAAAFSNKFTIFISELIPYGAKLKKNILNYFTLHQNFKNPGLFAKQD